MALERLWGRENQRDFPRKKHDTFWEGKEIRKKNSLRYQIERYVRIPAKKKRSINIP